MEHNKHDFVWYELLTPDLEGSANFYRQVVGWTLKDVGGPGMRYYSASMDGSARGVGGMMELSGPMKQAGASPGWTGYIFAEDVDVATENVKLAGGHIHREPGDIPGVGRFSVLSDPQGAVFQLFRPSPQGEVPPPLAPNAVGNVGWVELGALDWQKEWEFYSSQFGWTLSEGYDMGPMGRYQTFSTNGQPMTGGMMTVPEPVRAMNGNKARWAYYFNVDHIQRAKERLEAGGGTVLHGPAQVPGGGWIIQAMDPQGVPFHLHSANG